jgi:hypothetical protein
LASGFAIDNQRATVRRALDLATVEVPGSY